VVVMMVVVAVAGGSRKPEAQAVQASARAWRKDRRADAGRQHGSGIRQHASPQIRQGVERHHHWLDGYGGGLFLPFTDSTSGAETYGAGRYLLDTVKGADLGAVGYRPILDFNFAYQPSCSYDPQWSCPLPPPANRMAFEVPAGERLG